MSTTIKTKGDIEAAFHAHLNTLPVPDKKRRRASFFAPVQRFWVRNPDGGRVRFLQVSRYDDEGNERDYQTRLASNDPRPLGIQLCKNEDDAMRRWYCANIARVPFGQWAEIVYADPVEPTAPKPVLLLTWPDMKGAA